MKEEPMENDRDRDAWLGSMMRSPLATASDMCVDAETLAAWADGALDARHSAAVELHASNCSRCMAALASLERTVPVPEEPKRSWVPWRWLVPLTAAATAVAVWIAVPDRPITQVQPAPSRQEAAPVSEPPPQSPEADSRMPEPPPGQPPSPGTAVPEREPEPVAPPPGAQTERRAAPRPVPREEKPVSSDDMRDRAAARETFSGAPTPALPPASAPAPAASPQAPPAGAAADAQTESVLTALQRQALAGVVPTSESTALTNSLIRWRVMDWISVERSIDGGKTWIKTAQPPGVAANDTPAFAVSVVSVRAVDALRATVTTSDGREFYTTNGGLAWERLQGNSPAPF